MPGPYHLSYNISAMQFEIRENYISSCVPSRDCFRYLEDFVVPYGASPVALTIKNLPAMWRLGSISVSGRYLCKGNGYH